MAAIAVLKLVNVHIFFTKLGRNMNEVCFCMFSNMRNPMLYSEVQYNEHTLKKIEIVEINVIFRNEQFFKQVTTTTFIFLSLTRTKRTHLV